MLKAVASAGKLISFGQRSHLEFAIGEISGPPNQHQHSHFFEDKIKIAKMLKIMLDRIVQIHGGTCANINMLKLYGLQFYGEYFRLFNNIARLTFNPQCNQVTW